MSDNIEAVVAAAVAKALAEQKGEPTTTIFDESPDDGDDRSPDEIINSIRDKDKTPKAKPKEQSVKNSKGETARNADFYRKMRKEEPRKYQRASVQARMMRDREALGYDKYWGKS